MPADYMVPAVHTLPGFVSAAACAQGASGPAWWISNEPADQKWHADIVTFTGNYDGKGPGTWVLGIAGASQSVPGTLHAGTAMLTKTSDGPDKGRYYLLDLVFHADDSVSNSNTQNWGAAWNYYDNLVFADNDGSGVFLARRIYIDDPSDPNNRGGTVQMMRIGASDP